MGYPARIEIMGAPLDPYTMEQTVSRTKDFVETGVFAHLAGVNADKLLQMRSDQTMDRMIRQCEIVNADGASMVMAARRLGIDIPERVAGIDLMHELCRLSQSEGYRIFLLGATRDTVETEPCVGEFVTPGRKRQPARGRPGDKARLDTVGRADLREPGGISSLPLEVEPPGCRVRRCDVGGKDLGLVVSARSQEQQRGVCLVEFLILIAVEGGKHAAVFHVVSIYDRIGFGKARL